MKLNRLRIFLFVLLLPLSACSITNYRGPEPGQPVADLQFRSAGIGFEIYTLFDDATCSDPGANMAWFNGSLKTETVQLTANRRLFIVSGHRVNTGISTVPGGSVMTANLCQFMVSFVPSPGHRYSYRHAGTFGPTCQVEVRDLDTGKAPETFQEHPLKGCTKLVQ